MSAQNRPKAVIYARVSSDPNATFRSTTEQLEACREQAEREGWDVVAEFVDNDRGASRYSQGDRPAYREMTSYLTTEDVDVLVAWEASRTTRDTKEAMELHDVCRERRIKLAYSGRVLDLDDPNDEFTTGLDALLAAKEASLMSQRIRRSMKANASQGRPHGPVPYGYTREYDPATGALARQIIDEEEAAHVREAAERFLAGEGLARIVNDFNERGIPTSSGRGEWRRSRMKRMLTNPAYIAKRVHKGEVVSDGNWPPILDEATFYAIKNRMDDPARKASRTDHTPKHLVSGIATCGECGGRIAYISSKYYQCRKDFCVARVKSKVDPHVEAAVIELLKKDGLLESFLSDDRSSEYQEAQAELERLTTRLNAFYDQAADGSLSPHALAKVEERLRPQIEAAERRATPSEGVPALVADVAGPDAEERFDALPIESKREVIRILVDIKINKTEHKERGFRPEHLTITPKR